MCGISVIIDPGKKRVTEHQLKAMNNLIRHRGPDAEGFYFGDHFGLGHRMLKITDASIHGRQPMAYRQYVIILNGEIYNFKELRETLKQDGYSFQTASDTEVVMAAYDKWNTACVHHFVGMWSFVLFDSLKNTLFCSRDRFGIKPLFYTRLNNKLILGSEIKQLKAFPEFKPRINQAVAFDFLYHAKIDNIEDSFFEGVHYLPGGHHLVYNLESHTYTIKKWYDLDAVVKKGSRKFAKATKDFNELFTESVLLHSASKLPIGACLSGGLDSTSIVGVTQKIDTEIKTFSSCYTQHGFNEIEYINSAIKHYGVENHKNYPNIHELLDNNLMRKIVYHQDQPILSGSFFSEYKVYEMAASNNIRIMLSGQGADEYLGGYGEFNLVHLRRLLKKGRLAGFVKAIWQTSRRQKKSIANTIKSFIIFGLQLPQLSRKVDAQAQASANACLNRKWINQHHPGKKKNISIAEFDSLSHLSKAALTQYSLPHQLHSEDRNSMLYSIESRLPFLDHRLIEYCLGLPDAAILRDGTTKAVLRESLKEILPPDIYNRHAKLGFPGPEEALFTNNFELIKNEFREYIHYMPDIFSPALLDFYEAYKDRETPYCNFFFRVLSFGAWAKEFGFIPAGAVTAKAMAADTKPVFE
jgi:asparagine synthase (glutamine-hydrolysing)